jgi:hypothetical protein
VPALTENDLRVTCSSCGFPYPKVRGFCPHCGGTTQTDAAVSRRWNSVPARPQRELKMIAALVVLLICASLAMIRRYKVPGIPTRTVTSGSSIVQNAVSSQSATQQESASRDSVPTETEPHAVTIVEVQENPAELWRRVQSGSTAAEVELAKLYLDGKGVAQNCEQARLLLLAASKKQSGVASNLLSGDYFRRCQ